MGVEFGEWIGERRAVWAKFQIRPYPSTSRQASGKRRQSRADDAKVDKSLSLHRVEASGQGGERTQKLLLNSVIAERVEREEVNAPVEEGVWGL